MSKNKGLQPTQEATVEPKDIVQRKAGRPPGAKNKDTLFKELMRGRFQDIAEVNVQKTFEVLFEKAHGGDIQAIKLVLDRVVPASKAIDMEALGKRGGLVVNVQIGDLEQAQREQQEAIDAEFTEVEDDA